MASLPSEANWDGTAPDGVPSQLLFCIECGARRQTLFGEELHQLALSLGGSCVVEPLSPRLSLARVDVPAADCQALIAALLLAGACPVVYDPAQVRILLCHEAQ
jgi:hypothetical protein